MNEAYVRLSSEFAPLVRELLEHEDVAVCGSAALTLADMGDTDSIPMLRKLLQHDHPWVCANAAWALGTLGDTGSVPGLHDLLQHEDAGVCANAAWALGCLWDTDSIPRLRELLEHDDARVCANSAWALGTLRDTGSIPALRQLLQHDHAWVCAKAAWALGTLDDTESIPGLRRLLAHEQSDVCGSAVWALGSLRDTESTPKARELLQSNDASVCGCAAWAVGCLQDTESIPKLRELLHHDVVEVRGYAVWALGKLGDTGSIPVVRKLLQDDHPWVRTSAACVLAKLAPKRSRVAVARTLRGSRVPILRVFAYTAYNAIRRRLPDHEEDGLLQYLIFRVLQSIPSKDERLVLGALEYPLFQRVFVPNMTKILRPDGYETLGDVLLAISPTVAKEARLDAPFGVPLARFDTCAHLGFFESVERALRCLSRGRWQVKRSKYHGRPENKIAVILSSEIRWEELEGGYLEETVADPRSDPVSTAERAEAFEILHDILRNLPPEYELALRLRFWHGLTYEQCSREVGRHERQLRRFLATTLKEKLRPFLEIFREAGLIADSEKD